MASAIIQLGLLSREDDLGWWLDPWIWDDDTISSVHRPTEVAAFRHLFRQSRLYRKKGMYIYLSPMHRLALRLEYSGTRTNPTPDNIYQWISERMNNTSPLKVKALLEECSLVTLMRDVMGMPPLEIDWNERIPVGRRRAA